MAFNISYAYGLTSLLALALAVGYWGIIRRRDLWLVLLFLSVVLVNLGYFSLSISRTLGEALLANRIAYLGSVFLPLCMLRSVLNVCCISCKKAVSLILLGITVIVFLIAASPGYLDCYYSSVELVFVNGAAALKKTYGPLHIVYLLYLLGHFGAMVAVTVFAILKKRISSGRQAALLLTIVCLNMAIWGVEQLVDTGFEFLSLSYIASELLLLLLCGTLQNHESSVVSAAPADAERLPAEQPAEPEKRAPLLSESQIAQISQLWAQTYQLTGRETDVLQAILRNTKRKTIAELMHVTEHTVKKHTGNIFSKLGVANRQELFAKATTDLIAMEKDPA